MIQLNNYITEKLKINSKSKVNVNNIEILDPKDFDNSFEHIGYDYNGNEIVILGKPFKDKNDKNYKESKNLIKRDGYEIHYDLEDMLSDAPKSEYYIYACPDDMEVYCYVYGELGAYAINTIK